MAHKASRFLQYLYFLRFSILLWLLLPILVWLDHTGGTTSITRGIFALESPQQAFWAAFFAASANMVVLITVRIVCVNGKDRFGVQPPAWLARWFGNQSHDQTWRALLPIQTMSAVVLGYVGYVSVTENGISWPKFLLSAGLGILAALVFWYGTSLFYYWTYDKRAYLAEKGTLRSDERAMPLIFPPAWFRSLEDCEQPWFAGWFSRLRLRARLSYEGYSPSRGAPMWELHFFSTVALWGFVFLYLFLMPVNAPVTLPWEMDFLLVVAVIPAAALLAATLLTSTAGQARAARWTKIGFLTLPAAIIATWFFCTLTGKVPREERGMPTLASILVLSILVTWFLSALAFFFDRFHMPVLSLALAVAFVPKIVFPKLIPSLHTGEHYFSAVTLPSPQPVALPTPAQVLDEARKKPGPLVIITATGGGIHAAGWTAEILADLEKRFALDASLSAAKYSLHDHILLASSVSGGSVGMVSYLREFTAQTPFGSNDDVRRRRAVLENNHDEPNNMGFTKLHNSILTSTVWREDPATKVVWITMLALANRDGIVEASVPGLAHFAGVTVEEAEFALTKFLGPDQYSRSSEHEGRRIQSVDGGWCLLNYEKYRQKLSAEDAREKNRLRQQRHRERRQEAEEPEDPSDADCDINVTERDKRRCPRGSRHSRGRSRGRDQRNTARGGKGCQGDQEEAVEEGHAVDMLNTFASVGAVSFDITLTDIKGAKQRFRRNRKVETLRRKVGAMLQQAQRNQNNLIIRPRSTMARLVQLDDLKAETVQNIAPYAFLIIRTSPGSHQVWIALKDATEDVSRRLKEGVGADANASGATRIAGSRNFKADYAPNFPIGREEIWETAVSNG